MSCIGIFGNISTRCGRQIGGVRAIYIVSRSEISSATVDDTWCISIGAGDAWRIPVRGSFESVAQVDEATGAVHYVDTLSVTPSPGIQDNSYATGNIHSQLASMHPCDIVVIVENWNDDMFIMGYGFADDGNEVIETPVFFGGGQYASGTEKTDANGQSFILTSVHPQLAANGYLADATVVENPSTD